MFKTVVILVLLICAPLQSYAKTIGVEGKKFYISFANPLALENTKPNSAWVVRGKFAKLAFEEFETSQKITFDNILRELKFAPNSIIQDKFGAVTSDNSLIIDQSIISDTAFVRFQKIIGNNQNSAVLRFTLPLKYAEELNNDIDQMLSSISWKPTEIAVIGGSPQIQLSVPNGFKLTKKYLNSIVLVTTPDNLTLPQGNAVISLLPEVNSSETLQELTTRLLSEAQTLDKIQIIQVSEESSALGSTFNARIIARYKQTQVEVDISHVTIELGEQVLFVQVSAPHNAESFLKLEYLSKQFLDALEYYTEEN